MQSPELVVPYLKLLIYGEPGAGKTWLAATAQDSEETKPILFLDSEGGTVTIRKRKDVDVRKIRSMQEVQEIQNILYADDGGYYKTVVIDSLTELQHLDLRTVMKEEYNQKPDKIDIDVATQRAWGKSRERLTKIITSYRDLPCNIVCTALLGSEVDEVNGGSNYFPAFPGKLRGEIPGYFDIVGYLRAEDVRNGNTVEVIRKLQVAKTKRVVAKDRTSALGDVVDNPSIPLMWELINNG